MNTRIKTIIRQRNREFDKNGKSEKWRKLLKKSKSMVTKAKKSFSENFISSLKDTDPSTWMKRMSKLLRRRLLAGNFKLRTNQTRLLQRTWPTIFPTSAKILLLFNLLYCILFLLKQTLSLKSAAFLQSMKFTLFFKQQRKPLQYQMIFPQLS